MKNIERCAMCQEAVAINEDFEMDIRKLHGMVMAVEEYFMQIFDWHCDSPGFDHVHNHLGRAVGNPEELLMVLPED